MVLQCINGVGSNPVEGRTKNLTALKSNSNTVWFNFQTYIYIVGTNCALIANNPLHFHIIDVCRLAMTRSIYSLKWLLPFIFLYLKSEDQKPLS